MLRRRNFLKNSALAITGLTLKPLWNHQPKVAEVVLRFALASDGHFGQPNTPYEKNHDDLVKWMKAEKTTKGLDLVLVNGDLVHDKVEFMPQVKTYFDRFPAPYYVTRGNHDHIDLDGWQKLWGYGTNHAFTSSETAFVLADTSNAEGKYLCPDVAWIEQQFKKFASSKHIFLVMHITPAKWTDNGVDCPDLRKLIAETPNVRAVFHGHDHDQDDKMVDKGKPYFFDGHFGGSWGTTYRGYRIVEVRNDGSWVSYQCNPDLSPIINTFEGKAK